jgi:hypothetical protein
VKTGMGQGSVCRCYGDDAGRGRGRWGDERSKKERDGDVGCGVGGMERIKRGFVVFRK